MAILLGAVALAGGFHAILLWSAAVGGLAGAATAWARSGWTGVTLSAGFEPSRVFAGEPVGVRVRITNEKRLPIPLARVFVRLPPGLMPARDSGPATARGFHRRLFLPARSESLLELPIEAKARGEYWLESVIVELSDPFDLVPLRRETVPEAPLLVMPEPRIRVPARVRQRLPFGTPAPSARLFEDRERFAGVRPYEPGDPLNRVHWKLTAHAGGLQTKLFEPTRTADALLAVDLAAGEPFWDSIFPEAAENAIGWASFLVRQAIGAGWRIGLVANTHLRRGRGPLRVPPASAKGHEAALFAALARMPNQPTSDLGPVLREAGRGLGRGTSVVVISMRPGPLLRHEVEVLRRRGSSVVGLSPLEALLEGAS